MSVTETSVEVRLLNVAGAKTDGGDRTIDDAMPVFDFRVKLEEVEKRPGTAIFSFAFAISTKPSVAKIDLNGTVTVNGENAALEKLLQNDPDTKVPYLLKRVYQQVFLSAYLVSSMINVPHPPPGLLSPPTKT